jgi:hypothetical protein
VPTSLPTPYPGDDILLLSGTLPGCSGAANGCKEVSFGPADGYGGSLPAPYQFVANANRSCNFCLTGAQDGFGSVTFSVGSPSAISNSVATGAAISIQGLQGSRINSMTFVVVARTGATESFERGYH